jgi:hypothetical protein
VSRGGQHLAVAAAWALSCAGCANDEPPAPALDPVRVECGKLAAAWCDSAALCLSATFATAYGTRETCVQRRTTLCERTGFGEGSLLTPERLAQCVAASDLGSKPVDEHCRIWLFKEVGRSAPICGLTGSLPAGARCLSGLQCQSGGCATMGLCGWCRELATAGGSCFEDGECAPDLACAGRVCASLGGMGAACGDGARCLPDLACRPDAQGVLRCSSRAMHGKACDPDGDDCALWPEQLACNPVQRRCEPYAIAGPGEPCGAITSGSGAVAVCSFGHWCSTDSAKCIPLLLHRWPCSAPSVMPFLHPVIGPCQAPAACLDQKCQIPDLAACSGEALP